MGRQFPQLKQNPSEMLPDDHELRDSLLRLEEVGVIPGPVGGLVIYLSSPSSWFLF